MEAMVRDIRVHATEVKVYKKIGVFEWASCRAVASLLPDCIAGMDIVSSWYRLVL